MNLILKAMTTIFLICILSACVIGAAGSPTISVDAPSDTFDPNVPAYAINYTLYNIDAADVKLHVIDAPGATIRTIDAGRQNAGTHAFEWDGKCDDGRQASEGVYTLKVIAGEGTVVTPQNMLRWDSGLLTSDPGLEYYPYAPAVDAQGNVYVTDGRQDCVLKFDPNGNPLQKWGTTGSGEGQFRNPAGIATDQAGHIYVVDALNSRVQKFDPDGRYLLQWGGPGSSNGTLNRPSDIATDRAGNVYVTDTWNHRVQCFDGNGSFLGGWGSVGSGEGQFSAPCGIAIGPDGSVYVADTYNDRIQKFSTDGAYLGLYGNIRGGRLTAPSGIGMTGSGNLLVVDDGNRRIQEITPDGSPLYTNYAPKVSLDPASATPDIVDGVGYLAWWEPIADGPESLVLLSEQGCPRVRAFDPFSVGDPTAITATASAIIDLTAPTITLHTPYDGARYVLNQQIPAWWEAIDSLSGLAATTGTTPVGSLIDTSTTGFHTFSVNATDQAGNSRSVNCRYYVADEVQHAYKPPQNPPSRPPTPGGAIVSFNGASISAELARTDDEINRGLMFRPSLPGGSGMLFVFGNEQDHTFTMANMNFPLDIIFIRGDLSIVSVARNAQPGTSGISSGGPCQYVLEVNAGVANGIGEGDSVQITWP